MAKLVEGSEKERDEVYRKHRDRDLTAEETKAKFQQDRQDAAAYNDVLRKEG